MLHTTLGGRPLWCFDASEPHSVRTSAATAPRPARTSPPHSSHQTLASLGRRMCFSADTCLPAQTESSWAGTGSELLFLFVTHPSGETHRSGVITLHTSASVRLSMCVCLCLCACVRACTSRVKDTKSWTKLSTGLKAIMNPFATCKCEEVRRCKITFFSTWVWN